MALAALAGLAASPAPAQGVVGAMTPALIREAIGDKEYGEHGCHLLKQHACYTTPYSRVAQAAQEAREKGDPFTQADVTPEMVAPTLQILAWPQPALVPGPGRVGPPLAVVAVTVRSAKREKSATVMPTETAALDFRYERKLLGDAGGAKGLVAFFPLSVLSEDNEVRIVYDGEGCTDMDTGPTSECSFRFDLKGVR